MRFAELTEAVDIHSSAFKTWFADSKVVDSLNQPQIVFHGTSGHDDAQVDHFRPLTHFGTSKAANAIIKQNIEIFVRGLGRKHHAIMPVYLAIKNPVRIGDLRGISHGIDTLAAFLAFGSATDRHIDPEARNKRYGVISLDDYETIHQGGTSALLTVLKAHNYDGFVYKNAVEDRGSTSWIIVNPSQVWPMFAAKND
jgi:hypothetical protein